MAQTYGLNAFSYSDLAKEIGIAKASIHHYFPTKDDLACEILSHYTTEFFASLPPQTQGCRERLSSYIELFDRVAQTQDKICLCLMYATDLLTISSRAQRQVQEFYLKNEAWLVQLFLDHQDTLNISHQKSQLLFSQLQGLLVRSRLMQDSAQFSQLLPEIISIYL